MRTPEMSERHRDLGMDDPWKPGQVSLAPTSRRRYVESGPRNAPWEALHMKTILVPLDGSALAGRAVPFAATIAKRAGWSILLLRAVNTMRAANEAEGRAAVREARAALDAVAATLAADGIETDTRVA